MLKKYFLEKIVKISPEAPVRDSLKETANSLSNVVTSRIKRKESGNILLIGPPGCGKSFVIQRAISQASDQVGHIEERIISGTIDLKNISSALKFEFDSDAPEVVILEGLVSLSQHERWLYGLLEEARKHHKLIIATSTKLDALDSLEKRIRSRFASSVMLLTPPSDKELIEISKSNLLLPDYYEGLSKKKIENWNRSVEDAFHQIYDQLHAMTMKEGSLGSFQSLFIPSIAALDENDPIFAYEPVLAQIGAQLDENILSGCSVFELIILMCYASLMKKGNDNIHFVALYQEYTVWKRQHSQKKYDIPRSEFKKCFERLLQLNIVQYSKAEKSVQKIYLPTRLKCPLVYLSQSINKNPIVPLEIKDQSGNFMAG